MFPLISVSISLSPWPFSVTLLRQTDMLHKMKSFHLLSEHCEWGECMQLFVIWKQWRTVWLRGGGRKNKKGTWYIEWTPISREQHLCIKNGLLFKHLFCKHLCNKIQGMGNILNVYFSNKSVVSKLGLYPLLFWKWLLDWCMLSLAM